MNLYAYAGNNPVSFSDPFGLRDCNPEREKCDAARRIVEAANSKIKQVWEETGGAALEALGHIAKQVVDGVANSTEITIDVNKGPLTTSIGTDGNVKGVDASTGFGLNVVATATVRFPSNSGGKDWSIGQLAGAGLVGGGSVKMHGGEVNGFSVSGGVGVQVPYGGLLAKLIQTISVKMK